MGKYIDEQFWKHVLKQPDWYLRIAEDLDRLEKLAEQEQNKPSHKSVKEEAYALVEQGLREGTIPLAKSGKDFDAGRKPIDTIVIHHTKNKPGMTLERLNAMQLLRIYGRYYANPQDPKEKHLKGQPVWSGHFYSGKQVFWGYHWLMRNNGTSEHILEDSNVGWHSGNWETNIRSVGICIDDDLTGKEPANKIIKTVAEVIKMNYPHVSRDKILGHCDVSKTECPGHLFHEKWRAKLIEYLQR